MRPPIRRGLSCATGSHHPHFLISPRSRLPAHAFSSLSLFPSNSLLELAHLLGCSRRSHHTFHFLRMHHPVSHICYHISLTVTAATVTSSAEPRTRPRSPRQVSQHVDVSPSYCSMHSESFHLASFPNLNSLSSRLWKGHYNARRHPSSGRTDSPTKPSITHSVRN